MNINEQDRRKIEQLLSLDVDGLMSLLPAYDLKYELARFAPEGQLRAGREIYKRLKKQLYRQVCIEWQYCKKKNSDKYLDPVVLVAAIADVLSSLTVGIPPFVIATLLFKIGLSNFCHCK